MRVNWLPHADSTGFGRLHTQPVTLTLFAGMCVLSVAVVLPCGVVA